MSIHSRIKERRLAVGLSSHKALADLLTPKVSWQTVQLWEKEGGTAPNRNRINQVAQVLKCSVEWLTTGREDLNAENTGDQHEQVSAASPVEKMALHYISPREERLLEQFRLSFEEGREKIEFAAESTKKRSLSGVRSDKSQNG